MVRTPRSHCRGMGSIPGQETKIPHAEQAKKRKRERDPGSLSRRMSYGRSQTKNLVRGGLSQVLQGPSGRKAARGPLGSVSRTLLSSPNQPLLW